MRLEGTLDAFSLPDIFQLLSFTKKTGALHLRRPVDAAGAAQHGVVHVRDTLLADRGTPARQFAREAMALSPTTLAYEAFAAMRDASEQLAVVREDGRVVGVVTVGDILRWLLPRVDDEAGA